jgi:PAS domain S-box-containing protein
MKDTLKILFNEDAKLDAELIWRELENSNIVFKKLLVDNKKDFIEGLKSFKPDLIISDYSLPQFDGMSALLLRNEMTPLTPFILVTGSNNETVAVECIKAGADDYILKDNLSRLGHSVINAINKAKVLGEKNKAEAELKSSFSLMEATFESIHNGILVVGSDGTVIKANKKFAEMWHISKEVLDSRDDNKLLESILDQLTDPDEFVAKVKELYENPKSESVDLITFKDGRIFERISKPMYLGSKPKGRVWSFLDITNQKQSEDALRQSELRFKQISDNSGEWIWEVDKNGMYTYTSSLVKDLLGYEPEEIINKKYFFDFFIPETREEHKQAAMDAFASRVVFSNFINPNLHKNGTVVILSTSGLPLVDDEGNLIGYRGVDTNITAQKHAEDVIIHERSMLRTLIDNLPDLVYVKDLSGRKLISNIADVKNIGFDSEEEVVGKTDLELFSGNTGKRGHDDDMEVINSGNAIFGREEDFVDPKGNQRWLLTSKIPLKDKNGIINGLVGIGHDITNRRNAEEELHQSYVFNESLLKTIPFGMDIVDESGTVLFHSENLRKIFGEEGIGNKCWNLYRDDKTQCSDCPLRKGITVGETESYESHGVLGGRVFEINHTGMIYQGKRAMLEIFQDITDRKVNEAELITAKEKAEESDRLKTAFLHNISHEIRTPMNAIVGFSALLGEPDLNAQSRMDYIEVIIQSSNHLLAIISDIVDISNIEANLIKIVKNDINLNSVLKSLCEQFIPKAGEKKIQLICESNVPDSDAIIITDSTKLSQILLNLINNAIKFTDKGYVKVGCLRRGQFLEFNVSDTGIGISEEYHQKIFDHFYQIQHSTSRLYEGTGLGLAISKSNVEIMGGKIWLTSEPGKGTSFFFTIPYEKQVAETLVVNEKKVVERFVFPVKKTILVAEDSESNFKLISYFLSAANTKLIRASNGKEAVELALTNKDIDLILMDIKMPVMDGYTATKLIRESIPDIPIIAQTAYADDKTYAIECGCTGFMLKPFDKKGLLKVINELI